MGGFQAAAMTSQVMLGLGSGSGPVFRCSGVRSPVRGPTGQAAAMVVAMFEARVRAGGCVWSHYR
eukprot:153505-Lingulodinium_polyedra.AAC.1